MTHKLRLFPRQAEKEKEGMLRNHYEIDFIEKSRTSGFFGHLHCLPKETVILVILSPSMQTSGAYKMSLLVLHNHHTYLNLFIHASHR
jgi:hypothetical protein